MGIHYKEQIKRKILLIAYPCEPFCTNLQSHAYAYWACPDSLVVQGVTTDCLLPFIFAQVRIPAGACDGVASDLGLGGAYRSLLYRFQVANHELA